MTRLGPDRGAAVDTHGGFTSPEDPLHIVQIAPEIAPGSGVAMVAYALEREFVTAGCVVERFTLTELRGRPPSTRSRLAHAWDVVWFSTIGTARARRFITARPDAISICHNDAMIGDIYVNHGVLQAAMRARGMAAFRYLRNPTHVFTHVRDRARYRGGTHRVIVALADTEAAELRRAFGRVGPPVVIIPNGVDLDRFRPPTADERRAAREALGLLQDEHVVLFVGHEFDRKGLPVLIQSLSNIPQARLLVVGGDTRQMKTARQQADRAGVSEQVLFAGRRTDVVPFLHAADSFALPSAYEANALALLEALASGLPVLATPVGGAADIVSNGSTGFLVPPDPRVIGARLAELMEEDLGPWKERARSSVTKYSWSSIARQDLALAERVARERG